MSTLTGCPYLTWFEVASRGPRGRVVCHAPVGSGRLVATPTPRHERQASQSEHQPAERPATGLTRTATIAGGAAASATTAIGGAGAVRADLTSPTLGVRTTGDRHVGAHAGPIAASEPVGAIIRGHTSDTGTDGGLTVLLAGPTVAIEPVGAIIRGHTPDTVSDGGHALRLRRRTTAVRTDLTILTVIVRVAGLGGEGLAGLHVADLTIPTVTVGLAGDERDGDLAGPTVAIEPVGAIIRGHASDTVSAGGHALRRRTGAVRTDLTILTLIVRVAGLGGEGDAGLRGADLTIPTVIVRGAGGGGDAGPQGADLTIPTVTVGLAFGAGRGGDAGDENECEKQATHGGGPPGSAHGSVRLPGV